MKLIKWIVKRVPRGILVQIRKFSGYKYIEDYTAEERRKMWPLAATLTEKHLCHCRVLENRIKMLEFMPKNAICAEIGIFNCEFSEMILKITQPSKLHLIDIEEKAIRKGNEKFLQEIKEGKVETTQGDSSTTILAMPDQYFDWVYIDGDHSYTAVQKDLEAVRLKLKPNGLIALNDYIYFSPTDCSKYGVIEAVNEFCVKYDYEMIFLAFQGRTYNDVVLKKI